MHKRIHLAVLASLTMAASGACIGELDPIVQPGDDDQEEPTPATPDAGVPEATEDTAEDIFTQNVAPIVARCTGEACHAGTAASPLKFLGSGASTEFYSSITQFPSVTGNYQAGLANMLLKIDSGTHYSNAYTPAERSIIIEWLDAENLARNDANDDGTVDPPPAGDPLAEWSGCMTKANWDNAQMGSWANKGSDEGPCSTCHNDGAFRFNANDDNDTMFSMNRYQLYIIGFFTVKVETDGTQTVIPAYDKFERMGNGSTLHPRFNYSLDSTTLQRLEQFYQLTMETKAAGQCGPAQFPTP